MPMKNRKTLWKQRNFPVECAKMPSLKTELSSSPISRAIGIYSISKGGIK